MTSRTFLISGASKGIGLTLAKRLSNSGHRVVGLARNATDVEFPGEFVSVDLGDDKWSGEVVSKLVERHAIDGVIKNVFDLDPVNEHKYPMPTLECCNGRDAVPSASARKRSS